MSKILKVTSLFAFLTCLFSSLNVNASLRDQFKKEQTGRGDCNLQTSKWYGITYFSGRVNDARFCFSGDIYRYYDGYFPNGKLGGKLNTKVREWDRSLSDYYLTELALVDDYFIEYKCKAYTNSWDCRGPITQKIFGARDYLAFYSDGEALESKWKQDQENANKLEAAINSYTNSINLNPLNNTLRKTNQSDAYYQRADLLEQRAFLKYGTNYENPQIKGNKYHKQAIQDITNAIKLLDDKKVREQFQGGIQSFLNARAGYKFAYYEDKKYACEDIKKSRDLGNSLAKDNYRDFCQN